MPILNPETSAELQDFKTRETIAGQDVHVASYKGENEVQNDRLGVMEMPNCREGSMPLILKEAMRQAKHALRNNARQAENPRDIGTCTTTLAAYDPRSYTLDILAAGDSPAFLILDDSKKVEVVMVSTPVAEYVQGLGKLTMHLNGWALREPNGEKRIIAETLESMKAQTNDTALQEKLHSLYTDNFAQQGSYRIGNTHRQRGTINIEALKNEAAAHYGMDVTNMKVSLLVASDGISAMSNDKIRAAKTSYPELNLITSDYVRSQDAQTPAAPLNRIQENIVKALYEQAKASKATNLSRSMVKTVLHYKGFDNMAVTLISDLEKHKGEPLIACVADTAGEIAKPAAHIAINRIQEKLPVLDQAYAPKSHAMHVNGDEHYNSQPVMQR